VAASVGVNLEASGGEGEVRRDSPSGRLRRHCHRDRQHVRADMLTVYAEQTRAKVT
jgi:hypothetical protein